MAPLFFAILVDDAPEVVVVEAQEAFAADLEVWALDHLAGVLATQARELALGALLIPVVAASGLAGVGVEDRPEGLLPVWIPGLTDLEIGAADLGREQALGARLADVPLSRCSGSTS